MHRASARSILFATLVAKRATGVRRGLEILSALGGEEAVSNGGLGVVRIAELIGREKSQVSRTLQTLAEYRVVDRDPETLGYRLGPRFFVLATRVAEQRLFEAAPSLLARLVRKLGERAHLSVLDGAGVPTLLSESPPHAVQAAGWAGRTVPAYCTSSGRALLLDHSRDEFAALFGGVRFESLGPSAPGGVEELWERIVASRARGYAMVDEEFEPGLVAVAAPVRDFRGRIVAALNVSAPKFRLGHRLEAAGREVKAAADDLSRLLGRGADEWRGAAECS